MHAYVETYATLAHVYAYSRDYSDRIQNPEDRNMPSSIGTPCLHRWLVGALGFRFGCLAVFCVTRLVWKNASHDILSCLFSAGDKLRNCSRAVILKKCFQLNCMLASV